jgi:hypothetical protein
MSSDEEDEKGQWEENEEILNPKEGSYWFFC